MLITTKTFTKENAMSYTHFTLEERTFLYLSKKEGLSIRKISELMGRSPSSISRELRRNVGKKGYRPAHAHFVAQKRKHFSKITAICPGSIEYEYVCSKLKLYWPPEAIAGRWNSEGHSTRISANTIYRHIRLGLLPGISAKDNLRRRGKRPKCKHGGQMTIHPNRLISEWPTEISNRSRIGDWEGDTITGKIGSGLIDTLVDRRSRYLIAGKVPNKAAKTNRASIEKLLSNVPVKSISFDNGVEFAEHEAIEQTLGTKVYFAEPHSPWQRGTNEYTNGLLRFFFPRGSDFKLITQEEVECVVELLNNRPRKCLGWKTPKEIFLKGVALT